MPKARGDHRGSRSHRSIRRTETLTLPRTKYLLHSSFLPPGFCRWEGLGQPKTGRGGCGLHFLPGCPAPSGFPPTQEPAQLAGYLPPSHHKVLHSFLPCPLKSSSKQEGQSPAQDGARRTQAIEVLPRDTQHSLVEPGLRPPKKSKRIRLEPKVSHTRVGIVGPLPSPLCSGQE